MSKNKIISLQSLRAIAFICIFLHHCGMFSFGAEGVSIFIILSGFLMIYQYYNKDIKCGIKNNFFYSISKIKKIYPLHIICIFLVLPFTILDMMNEFSLCSIIENLINLILNVLLLQSWVPNGSVYFSYNGVAWYLSLCVFLYFVFPWILTNIKKYKSVKQAYKTFIIVLIIQILIAFLSSFLEVSFSDGFAKYLTYICPLFRLGDFIIGCNLGYIFLNRKTDKMNAGILKFTALEFFTIVAVIISQVVYVKNFSFLGSEWFKYSLLYIPTSISAIYLFALSKGLLTKMLTNKITIYIGNLSAYTFLLHTVVIRYTSTYISPFINSHTLNVVIYFVITVILAVIYQKVFTNKKNIKTA